MKIISIRLYDNVWENFSLRAAVIFFKSYGKITKEEFNKKVKGISFEDFMKEFNNDWTDKGKYSTGSFSRDSDWIYSSSF